MAPLPCLSKSRRGHDPILVLRRPQRDGGKPAVWHIAYAGRLISTRCEAHERSKVDSVLAHYAARLRVGITAPIEMPSPDLRAMIEEYLDAKFRLLQAPKRRHHRKKPAMPANLRRSKGARR